GNYRLEAISHGSGAGDTTIGEVGYIDDLTHTPQTIVLSRSYVNPVVIVQPPSMNGINTSVVRITNVQSEPSEPSEFTLYVDEAPDQDGPHDAERVSYLVLEAGSWELANGVRLEVGQTTTNATTGVQWETVSFNQDFRQKPVVFSQVQSNNDPHWVKTRQNNTTVSGFEVAMEEDDAQTTAHGTETVGWVAMEVSQGSWNNHLYEVGESFDAVTHDWYQIEFAQPYSQPPRFIGALATTNGADGSSLRYNKVSLTTAGVQVLVEEDTMVDSEIEHTTERASYLAIEGDGLLTARVSQGTSFWQAAYNYDTVGNISSLTTTIGGVTDIQTFAYDNLNRLTMATGSGGGSALNYGYEYTYDPLGNIDSVDRGGVLTSYHYDDHSQPHAVKSLTTGAQTDELTYDANGNMTERNDGNDNYMQVFDVENRLTSVTKAGEGTTTFFYDANGQRVMTIKPDETTIYYPFPGYEEEVRPAPPTPPPTVTPTNTPLPTSTPTNTPLPTATPTSVPPITTTLLIDDFNRPDNAAVGNGWVEVETTGAAVEIASNQLCFVDTSDVANRPLVKHSFQQVNGGQL
ncbi:MAG: RHS repeat protein, partial [Chloroflexi bacterium]|nr:RHS repeat protein [Chloroflexota bacterium]